MKTLLKLFRTRPLVRPTVYLAVTKAAIVLLLSLLWERFMDQGQRGTGYALGVFGLVFLLFSWFHYLSLDGVSPFKGLFKKREAKRKARSSSYDMIDFVDEPITPYRDLEPEERTACQLVSSFGIGVIFIIISFFV